MLELAAALIARIGTPVRAARLVGAADAVRQQTGDLRGDADGQELQEFLRPAVDELSPQQWEDERAAGGALSVEEAPELLLSLRSAAELLA